MGRSIHQPLSSQNRRAGQAHHRDRGSGRTFVNPGRGGYQQPPASVYLPFFARRVWRSIVGPRPLAAPRIPNDGHDLRAWDSGNGQQDQPATVTWVGHSTLLIQMGGLSILTDPVWARVAGPRSLGPGRMVDPGLAIDDLPPIDVVLVSHNHYDHMDLVTLGRLAERGKGRTRFLVPLQNGDILEQTGIGSVTELDWWDSLRVGEASIHCVPAFHWSRRGLRDTNRSLWSGWVVVAGGRRFYFAGDTGMFDGFEEIGSRLGPFDLAAVPIGAYEPRCMMKASHLNPEEAVEALQRLGADHGLAIHFGTFELSDEPFDEPPLRFSRASELAGRGRARDWVLQVGQTRLW
ncbi:MAG: MBL fold metallo-hydrolase [Deltaproteobacteria bacterium]